jgi:hypothetical protein
MKKDKLFLAAAKAAVLGIALVLGLALFACDSGSSGGSFFEGGGNSSANNLVGSFWEGEGSDTIEFISSREVKYSGLITAPYTVSGNTITVNYPVVGRFIYELRGNKLVITGGENAVIGYVFTRVR